MVVLANKVVVVGGGAAGMIAAGTASENGHDVTLIEKNTRLGRKMKITGKGRCNLTNACSGVQEFLKNVVTNGRFLYSAFNCFDNTDVMEFFESLNVPLKIERGNRVFPVSDNSEDIIDALEKYIKKSGVKIVCDTVDEVLSENDSVSGVVCERTGFIPADSVILATGGISYPLTGSTGDGYTFAENLGHTVTELRPALVPLTVSEKWVSELAGLSLKNVGVKVEDSIGKIVYKDFGEMMFAHFGITGPVVLSASSNLARMKTEKYIFHIDLKPALEEKLLDERILRDFSKNMNKDFVNSLNELLPKALIPIVTELSGISPHQKINSVTSQQRKGLTELLKDISLHITGFCPPETAIITSGGISVREINPSTMQSKIVNGLFFAGEIIDVDAMTGGFNLQIAFSTGRLAGLCC